MFEETADSNNIYQEELDKECFVHDAAYADFEDLVKRPISNKILKDGAYRYQTDITRYGVNIAVQVQYEPQMESLSSFNHGIKYLFCFLNVLNKYAWVEPLKDETVKTVLHDFLKIVNQSKSKPNRLQADQGRKFCNKLMQEW